jgi:hypothetical protein
MKGFATTRMLSGECPPKLPLPKTSGGAVTFSSEWVIVFRTKDGRRAVLER